MNGTPHTNGEPSGPDPEMGLERCARELLDSVPPVVWCIRRAMRRHRHGLSMPQFRALVQVHQSPRTCLSDIADNMGATLPTTSRLISGLVDHGLIDRVSCTQDRRQVILRITARGEEVLRGAWDAATESLAKLLGNLTEAQRRQMLVGLAVMKESFGAVGVNKFAEEHESARTQNPCADKNVPGGKYLLLEAPEEGAAVDKKKQGAKIV